MKTIIKAKRYNQFKKIRTKKKYKPFIGNAKGDIKAYLSPKGQREIYKLVKKDRSTREFLKQVNLIIALREV